MYNYITITSIFSMPRHTMIKDYIFSREDVNGVSIKNIFSILYSFYKQVLVPLNSSRSRGHNRCTPPPPKKKKKLDQLCFLIQFLNQNA